MSLCVVFNLGIIFLGGLSTKIWIIISKIVYLLSLDKNKKPIN